MNQLVYNEEIKSHDLHTINHLFELKVDKSILRIN